MKFTKKEMLQVLGERRGQRIVFTMPVEFDELTSNRMGIELLNAMVDEFVEDGYLLQDLVYTPIEMRKQTVYVEVDALATDWIRGSID
jgi:hypothetical protein